MPEPTSTSGFSLAVLAIAMMGPMAGPYALIVFAAISGALWPLSIAETASRVSGAWLLLRCTLTAVALTSALAALVQHQWQIPAIESLAPVAFFIGALGNGWRPVFGALAVALQTIVAGRAGVSNKEPKQ